MNFQVKLLKQCIYSSHSTFPSSGKKEKKGSREQGKPLSMQKKSSAEGWQNNEIEED
jgi:hypothetical protein